MNGTPTGETDRTGKQVCVGDLVQSADGFIGPVVFANCAFRVDTHAGEYLQYNSSLLYSEGEIKWTKIERGTS